VYEKIYDKVFVQTAFGVSLEMLKNLQNHEHHEYHARESIDKPHIVP
jgi:hypothetical protein